VAIQAQIQELLVVGGVAAAVAAVEIP